MPVGTPRRANVTPSGLLGPWRHVRAVFVPARNAAGQPRLIVVGSVVVAARLRAVGIAGAGGGSCGGPLPTDGRAFPSAPSPARPFSSAMWAHGFLFASGTFQRRGYWTSHARAVGAGQHLHGCGRAGGAQADGLSTAPGTRRPGARARSAREMGAGTVDEERHSPPQALAALTAYPNLVCTAPRRRRTLVVVTLRSPGRLAPSISPKPPLSRA